MRYSPIGISSVYRNGRSSETSNRSAVCRLVATILMAPSPSFSSRLSIFVEGRLPLLSVNMPRTSIVGRGVGVGVGATVGSAGATVGSGVGPSGIVVASGGGATTLGVGDIGAGSFGGVVGAGVWLGSGFRGAPGLGAGATTQGVNCALSTATMTPPLKSRKVFEPSSRPVSKKVVPTPATTVPLCWEP